MRSQLRVKTLKGEAAPETPAGAPAWVTPELLADTVEVWQPYYAQSLTPSDALGILLNVAQLIEPPEHGEPPDDEAVPGAG